MALSHAWPPFVLHRIKIFFYMMINLSKSLPLMVQLAVARVTSADMSTITNTKINILYNTYYI